MTTTATARTDAPGAGVRQPLRLGAVSYLNTLPLIEGLEKLAGLTITPAAPSHLAPMLARGEVDAALCPVIDAQTADAELTILPAGVIGSDGATMTVRLFSAVPIERAATLHVDTDSHTSVALARVILAERYGVRPEVVEFDARERVPARGGAGAEWPESLLLIGDKVVTDSPPAVRYPHQLDLGEAWRELTGLPFVYAAWMCRAGEERTDRVRLACALLDRQRRHNATRLDWIVASRAPQRRWPTDLARGYVRSCLRYELGEPERLAVEAFFDRAHAAGALARRLPTRWAQG